ncbi:MAG: YceI family protein [Pseudomonadota bacterium]
MRKTFVALTLLITASLPFIPLSYAQTPYKDMPKGVYNIDETHASVTWKVSHLGLSNYTARFTKFDADLTFDPAKPEDSKLVATIDPTSIATDYPYAEKKDFDKKLVEGKEWFNSKNFPKITFESSKIEKTGDNKGTMTGNLTFLGVSKPITFDVTFNGAMAQQPFSKKPTLGFSAEGTLKRSDWGMATYVPNIGDEVKVIIEAEFAKEK